MDHNNVPLVQSLGVGGPSYNFNYGMTGNFTPDNTLQQSRIVYNEEGGCSNGNATPPTWNRVNNNNSMIFNGSCYNQDQQHMGNENRSSLPNGRKRNYLQRPQGQTRFVRIRGAALNPGLYCGQQNMKMNMNYPQQYPHHNWRFHGNKYNFGNKGRNPATGNMNNRRNRQNLNKQSPNGFFNANHSKIGAEPMYRSGDDDMNRQQKSCEFSSLDASFQQRVNTGVHEVKKVSEIREFSSPGATAHNLSYEDITENSEGEGEDSTDDAIADLRERLLRRQQEKVVKREPGEIDSDDEKEDCEFNMNNRFAEGDHERSSGNANVKYEKCVEKTGNLDVHAGSSSRSSWGSPYRRSNRNGEEKPGSWRSKSTSRSSLSTHSYSNHDDRGTCEDKSRRSSSFESTRPKGSSPTNATDPGKECSSEGFCYAETELVDAKKKVTNLERVLRQTRDQLLEAKVIGSKKTLRLEEEISNTKDRAKEFIKKEQELKSLLKRAEDDLLSKKTELSKMTVLFELEKQEKTKMQHELTRTYQDKLSIEIDKLRALFDIEVAKMQAFYVSQSGYFDDGTILPFLQSQKSDLRSPHLKIPEQIHPGSQQESNISIDMHDTNPSGVPFMSSIHSISSHPHTSSLQRQTKSGTAFGINNCFSSSTIDAADITDSVYSGTNNNVVAGVNVSNHINHLNVRRY